MMAQKRLMMGHRLVVVENTTAAIDVGASCQFWLIIVVAGDEGR